MVTAPGKAGGRPQGCKPLSPGGTEPGLQASPFSFVFRGVCPRCRALSAAGGGSIPHNGGVDWFHAYLHDLRERDLAPATRARYSQVVGSYREWLQGEEPTPANARAFLAALRDRGYRPKSVCLYYAALRTVFGFLGAPFQVKLRKPKTMPPYWDPGDIERLIAQAERGLPGHSAEVRGRNTAAILLMAYAGLRRGEVLGLRVGDVDFRRRTIRVLGKGQKERVVPMAERVVVPLWEVCRGKGAGDRVFRLSPGKLHQAVTKLARAAGLEGFHCHSLRHSFATRLLEQGANVREVQQLLGHESLETTAVYLAVSGAHLRRAVDLLDAPCPVTGG